MLDCPLKGLNKIITIDYLGKILFINNNKVFYLGPLNVKDIRIGKNAIDANKIPLLDSTMDPHLLCHLPRSATGKFITFF